MKRFLYKLQTVVLLICVLTVFSPEAYGANRSLPIGVSDAYKNGKFYKAAVEAYNTYYYASDAERFVRVALSQNGYTGSTKKGAYNGVPAKGKDGNYTEYSRYMKKDGLDWCASFVSWAAEAAGISPKVIVSTTTCSKWLKKDSNGGTLHKIWTDDFKKSIAYRK